MLYYIQENYIDMLISLPLIINKYYKELFKLYNKIKGPNLNKMVNNIKTIFVVISKSSITL